MQYLQLKDIIVSFLLLLLYFITIYLILKQSFRILSFSKKLEYTIEKKIDRKKQFFLYMVLIAIYVFTIYKDVRIDFYYAKLYNYYHLYESLLPIKLAINAFPLLIIILFALYYWPNKGICRYGIIGDKPAFKWSEIKRIDYRDNLIKIYYEYKVIIFTINLIYTIDDRNGSLAEVINSYYNNL